jgi:hypothetical protein
MDRINDGCNSGTAAGAAGTPCNFPILALLVGTNEGIPLSRSYGTIFNHQQSFISDEVLSSIETVWATLPSATPPHVKNAMALYRQELNQHTNSTPSQNNSSEKQSYSLPKIKDPPHPLLSHLGLGDYVKTAVAFYDHLTLIHVHIAPLVVTILVSSDPNTNIGTIKLIAVPFLHDLLEPVKNAIIRLRYKFMNVGNGTHGEIVPNIRESSSGYYHA